MSFTLNQKLAADTIPIGDLSICSILLMNNRHFPWLVLVPRREGLREVFDMAPVDYQVVMEEVRNTAKQFAALTKAHKVNVATLGNQVPQLHVHIIARQPDDAAWPNPVWNANIKAEPYAPGDLDSMVQRIKDCLNITKM